MSENIDAHYSTDMKVKRPVVKATDAPLSIPKHKLFSTQEADKKIKSINTDIYEGAQKEKAKNDFKKSLYFKIFGGIVLLTAGIAGLRRIRNFFRKS